MKNIDRILKVLIKKIRTWYWRSVLRSFGEHSRVLGRIVVYSPENVIVGRHSSLNEGVLLNARAPISIGDHVHISPYCIINAGGLDYSKTGVSRTHVSEPIEIKDGVWIGSGAVINPGVTIGENAVIAAGAIVTRSIAANMVAAGVPARELKRIDEKDVTLRAAEDKRNRED